MRKFVTYLTILLLIAFIGAIGYRFSARMKSMRVTRSAAEEVVPPGVEVVTVRQEPVEDIVEATGTLSPLAQVLVYAKVSGKLAKNLVEMNDVVMQDQVVALVDRDETGVQYEPAEVKTPIAGVVAKTFLDMGAVISPQVPIAQIVTMNQVKALVNVVEKDIGGVRIGQPALIWVDAYEESFRGTVTDISPVVNPQLRSAEVEITVPNAGKRLKPGMFARAQIVSGRKVSLTIPAASVVRREGKAYAFSAAGGRVQQREIVLGQDLGERTEVTSGLSQGELVVTAGAYGLKDGDKVTIRSGAPTSGGGK